MEGNFKERMDQVEQKICLDTDICIEIIKKNPAYEFMFDKFSSSDIFISSVTLFELFLREFRLDDMEKFVGYFTVLSFDEICATKGSEIARNLGKEGNIIDFRDIFIASSCIVNNCKLLTINRSHFERINDLRLVDIENEKI